MKEITTGNYARNGWTSMHFIHIYSYLTIDRKPLFFASVSTARLTSFIACGWATMSSLARILPYHTLRS